MGSWKIVSGGQTGVDRGALDAARALGLAYGGHVPKGRRTEDGALRADYVGMIETASSNYAVRTRKNARESDATLVLTRGEPDGGTRLTVDIVRAIGKPLLIVDLDASRIEDAAARVTSWLGGMAPGTLNVAGPRESRQPGIAAMTEELLAIVLNAPS